MTTSAASPRTSQPPSTRSTLSGWVVFSAVALITAGVMRVFDAFWAFRYHGVVPQNLEDALFGHSLKTYGWIWLVVAALLMGCGALLFTGSQVARWVGVVAAGTGAVSAIWWMPYYPIWSLSYLGICFAVMFGLLVYGGHDSL